jgi:hypothetical protein
MFKAVATWIPSVGDGCELLLSYFFWELASKVLIHPIQDDLFKLRKVWVLSQNPLQLTQWLEL